jgi:hypothetical protein
MIVDGVGGVWITDAPLWLALSIGLSLVVAWAHLAGMQAKAEAAPSTATARWNLKRYARAAQARQAVPQLAAALQQASRTAPVRKPRRVRMLPIQFPMAPQTRTTGPRLVAASNVRTLKRAA